MNYETYDTFLGKGGKYRLGKLLTSNNKRKHGRDRPTARN